MTAGTVPALHGVHSAGAVAASLRPPELGSAETRVLLVDDHALVRAGLRRLVEELPGVRVVAEAGDARAAFAALLDAEPELVLVDLELPEAGGAALVRRLLAERPELRVLVVSGHEECLAAEEALRAGAAGFVCKSAPAEELRSALEALRDGQAWLSPAVARGLAGRLRGSRGPAAELSQREREVLVALANGLSSREIAAELHLSPKTVDAHRVRLMRKLELHKAAQLVRYAIRAGLVAP